MATAPPDQCTVNTVDPLRLRRAAAASLVGSAIEFYEFTVYGFLAVVFGPLFFPSENPASATLAALVVYGGGYLARPLGGLVFGALGDRVSRRMVLMTTIFLMGISTALIGMLPTYAAIGIAAPLLLLLLRCIQGFSAGGEFSGAQTYIVEMAPVERRGFYGSLPAFGIGLGFTCGSFVVATVSFLSSPDFMTQWGWRIPFLLAIPLTIVCGILRLRLEDSPEFKEMVARNEVVKSPISDALRHHPLAILKISGLTIAILGPAFLVKLFMAVYLIDTRGLPAPTVYLTLAITLGLSSLLYPIAGRLSDRLGRRPIILVGTLCYVIFSLPLFLVVSSTTDLLLIGTVLALFMAIEPLLAGAVYTSFSEMLPGRVRSTGTAIGFNVGTIIAAGFGPSICAQLILSTGSELTPAGWGTATALIGLVVALFFLNETNGQRLKH
ncbi:MAG: MFS transporter [Corynebacterium sp.]|uniref:MFS transporter n=1 Tax=Corynebacterium sp. TaxID=1720 RepID=UPI003F0D2895